MIKKYNIKIFSIMYLVMGCVYFTMEGFFRFNANIIMFFIGGLCRVFLDLMNHNEKFYNLKEYQKAFIGLLLIWVIEFSSGCLFNLILPLSFDLWDYSNIVIHFYNYYIPLHILGQISLPFGLLFFCLVPLGTWLGDQVRSKIFDIPEKQYHLYEIYIDLITGK